MKDSKQLCLFCRNTGYIVYADENCTTTAYCDCPYGEAAWHRDEDLTVDDKFDTSDLDD